MLRWGLQRHVLCMSVCCMAADAKSALLLKKNGTKSSALIFLKVNFFFCRKFILGGGDVRCEHSEGGEAAEAGGMQEDGCCCHGFGSWSLSLCS